MSDEFPKDGKRHEGTEVAYTAEFSPKSHDFQVSERLWVKRGEWSRIPTEVRENGCGVPCYQPMLVRAADTKGYFEKEGAKAVAYWFLSLTFPGEFDVRIVEHEIKSSMSFTAISAEEIK